MRNPNSLGNPSWQGTIRELFKDLKFDGKPFSDSKNYVKRLSDDGLRSLVATFENLWKIHKGTEPRGAALSDFYFYYLRSAARNRGIQVNLNK